MGGSCTRVGEPDKAQTGRPEGLPRTATKKQVAACVQKSSERARRFLYLAIESPNPIRHLGAFGL